MGYGTRVLLQDGVQIGENLPVGPADFQVQVDAGRPGFFGLVDGNHRIGQNFDGLLVLLNLPLDQQGDEAEWVTTQSTEQGVVSTSRPIHPALVPNVVDMGLKDALFLLD